MCTLVYFHGSFGTIFIHVTQMHGCLYSEAQIVVNCRQASCVLSLLIFIYQQEFQYGDDTCYLAHCYPYTFTDLRDDLDNMLADPERSKVMKRQVLCETRAGNSCFLVTVTNFGEFLIVSYDLLTSQSLVIKYIVRKE